MYDRSIIHINVADFAVAVERVLDSRLRRRPVVIAPEGAARATVYDMSEEAYQNGVRKGMALRRALRYCHDAEILPPHPDRYERAMTGLLKCASPYSPLIEMTDHKGHLFIDATGTGKLFGPPPDLASRIRQSVRNDLGFDPIWSVASNKLLAKVATRMVKPTGEYIVKAGEEAVFLDPLPVYLIPGIEQEDLKRLGEFNLTHVNHVSRLSLEQLEVVFGSRSRSLHDAVRGIDPSPVSPVGHKRPIVSVDHAFGNDTNTVRVVKGTLYRLIEKAGADLRRQRLAARRIGLVLDYSDGGRIARFLCAGSVRQKHGLEASEHAAQRLARCPRLDGHLCRGRLDSGCLTEPGVAGVGRVVAGTGRGIQSCRDRTRLFARPSQGPAQPG